MKYKVINSALFLNGHLIPEGSTIELSESQTEGITDYLQPLEENPVPNSFRDLRTKTQSNIKKEK
jgi:hypothetical protein